MNRLHLLVLCGLLSASLGVSAQNHLGARLDDLRPKLSQAKLDLKAALYARETADEGARAQAQQEVDKQQAAVDKLQGEYDAVLAALQSDGSPGLDGFGFGLGVGSLMLRKPYVTNAAIDNGVVRVTGEEKDRLGLWLSTSWISDRYLTRKIGIGPFLAAQLGGNDQTVSSFGVGVALSFKNRRSSLSRKEQYPLDFQIGWAWTKVKTLASGYEDNKAPPSASTQVPLKETTRGGLLLLVSYNL